jgi:tRNA(Ile)-lysidine synthase
VNTRRVAVAYSAGRDSTALLHATASAAQGEGAHVFALHVHHGLSRHADVWLAHAEKQCAAWAASGLPVTLVSHRLQGRPKAGDSVEAWARDARYLALAAMAREAACSMVLLAHHRRDQAETLLLQALRGAGVAGLAGMPQVVEREGIVWSRPWLDKPREDIEAYVRTHRLKHVDDDSNDDTRFARNRLRLQVWPQLTKAFPLAEAALADAARWAAEAKECLDELARTDLHGMASAAGLDVAAWSGLTPSRRMNALRAWLKVATGQPAPMTLALRLRDELIGSGPASWPAPGGELRRYRGRLRWHAEVLDAMPDADPETSLSIRRAGRFKLPGWGGELVARRVADGGVPLAWLAQLALKPRSGGEQFQAGIGRPARSLKKQYQAAAVPEWQRAGPLVYSGGQLVFVPGLGLDARVLALPGQVQLDLSWLSS